MTNLAMLGEAISVYNDIQCKSKTQANICVTIYEEIWLKLGLTHKYP
jgi:hypothetical protein